MLSQSFLRAPRGTLLETAAAWSLVVLMLLCSPGLRAEPNDVFLQAPLGKIGARDSINPSVPTSTRLAAARQAPAAVATPNAAAPPQLLLRIQDRRGKRASYSRGESYEVEVAVGPQGFLYCYLIDVRRRPAQFFPNPQMPDAAVTQGGLLHFPGTSRFSLVAAREGGRETVVCLNSPTNLGATPALAAATDDGAIKARLEHLAGAGVQMAGFEVHAP